MKLIRTEDAVGHVLCHDMTQIIKDKYKDARFCSGVRSCGKRPASSPPAARSSPASSGIRSRRS